MLVRGIFFGLLGGTAGKHIRSDLADVQTRYDATLRALANPAATAEQRARLAGKDWKDKHPVGHTKKYCGLQTALI